MAPFKEEHILVGALFSLELNHCCLCMCLTAGLRLLVDRARVTNHPGAIGFTGIIHSGQVSLPDAHVPSRETGTV